MNLERKKQASYARCLVVSGEGIRRRGERDRPRPMAVSGRPRVRTVNANNRSDDTEKDLDEVVGKTRNVEFSRELNPELQLFDEWLTRNKDKISL